MLVYIHRWARLLFVVSLFAPSREMLAGGKIKNVLWVPGPLWAGPLWAGPYGPGPHGPPWGLMGRALMGPPGPLWAGPLWARPLWAPLGPHGPGPHGLGPDGPHGPTLREKSGQPPLTYFLSIIPMRNCHIYIYIYVYIYIYIYVCMYTYVYTGPTIPSPKRAAPLCPGRAHDNIYIYMAFSHRHDRKEISKRGLPIFFAECCIRGPGVLLGPGP